PKVTRRPGLSLPPGCPMASQLPSGSLRTSSSFATLPISRLPCSLAGMTRDTLRTSTSSGASRSTSAGKSACRILPLARSKISSRLAARSGSGSWAMSSAGRSYSKSEVRNLAVEDRRLVRGSRGSEAEMSVRGSRRTAAAGRAGQKALLHQERLVHLLQRTRILAHGGGDGGEAPRPALELLDDGLQDPAVHVVEAELVYVEPLQRLGRDRRR